MISRHTSTTCCLTSSMPGLKMVFLPIVISHPFFCHFRSGAEVYFVPELHRNGLTQAWHSMPRLWHSSVIHLSGSHPGATPRFPDTNDDQGSSDDSYIASAMPRTWKHTMLRFMSAAWSRIFVSAAFWTFCMACVVPCFWGQSMPHTVAIHTPRSSRFVSSARKVAKHTLYIRIESIIRYMIFMPSKFR